MRDIRECQRDDESACLEIFDSNRPKWKLEHGTASSGLSRIV